MYIYISQYIYITLKLYGVYIKMYVYLYEYVFHIFLYIYVYTYGPQLFIIHLGKPNFSQKILGVGQGTGGLVVTFVAPINGVVFFTPINGRLSRLKWVSLGL